MGIHVSINCPHCGKFNFIDTIEPFVRNRCRHCKNVLDENVEKANLEEIIQIGFKEGILEEIPAKCSDCKHFKKTGVLDPHKGRCNLYFDETFMSSTCIITKVDDMLEELGRTILPVCPKCDAELKNRKASFCRECGAEIYPKEYIKVANCDKCSENYPVDTKFCDKDGTKLKTIEIEKDSNIKKMAPKPKIIDKVDEEEIKSDIPENGNQELGFGWGNFWIGVCILQGLSLLFLTFYGLEEDIFDRGYAIIPFLLSILALVSGYTLINRNLSRFYLAKFLIIVNYGIGGLLFIMGEESIEIIRGLVLWGVGPMWWIYFDKRKDMFKP